jgi:hypothetical protein
MYVGATKGGKGDEEIQWGGGLWKKGNTMVLGTIKLREGVKN